MENKVDLCSNNEKSNEMKQAFFSSAISDISTYIQLSDTKVSIIMGSLVALIAGILACYDVIYQLLQDIKPCSWLGIISGFFILLWLISIIGVFLIGTLTIRGHVSNIGYKSKWFLSQSPKEYSFDKYLQDVLQMTDADIIENMAAELYKLNDINRQKGITMKWVIRLFISSIISFAIIGFLFFLSIL